MRTSSVWIIAVGIAACVPLARAGDEPSGPNAALNDKVFIELGAYFPKSTGQAQLNSSSLGIGTVVDFQNMLGMNERPSAADVAVRIRVSERWRVEASYFETTRSGDQSTEQEIQWGDKVYPIGTHLTSRLNLSDLRVSGAYSFYKTSDKEVGAGLGFHIMGYDASISSNSLGSETAKVLAPLPVVSLYAAFSMDERWSISSRLDRFSLTYDQYSGSITGMEAQLLYQPFRHFGCGIGYRYLFLDFSATSGDFVGKLNQTMQGPTVFLTASF